MILSYKLKFFDYWHLSSGLSSGAKLDSTVVKDSDDLPYTPAKTIKGLVREILEIDNTNIDFLHKCYFQNATLSDVERKQISANKLQDNFYDVIASTKIGDDGIAIDDSLREIEVVIPLTLEGKILYIPSQEDFDKLSTSLRRIKRMGLNRNRGLGRCEFIIEELS